MVYLLRSPSVYLISSPSSSTPGCDGTPESGGRRPRARSCPSGRPTTSWELAVHHPRAHTVQRALSPKARHTCTGVYSNPLHPSLFLFSGKRNLAKRMTATRSMSSPNGNMPYEHMYIENAWYSKILTALFGPRVVVVSFFFLLLVATGRS